MPTNLLKKYNELLEINHLSEFERTASLKRIFNRDIADNNDFKFRYKTIRPIKKEGVASLETLFGHLTCEEEINFDEKGNIYKQRNKFDFERSKRLHWILYHIEEKKRESIDIFSYTNKIKGRGKTIRTYIYDFVEKYIIILEPQKSKLDYYLISAYYLTKEKGGVNQIENKRKKKLNIIH